VKATGGDARKQRNDAEDRRTASFHHWLPLASSFALIRACALRHLYARR
jgi:hypothetical protein